MRYWIVNVNIPNYGYSFAVCSDICSTESDVIDACLELDYFDEVSDADYATIEEITNDAYELNHWQNDMLSLD